MGNSDDGTGVFLFFLAALLFIIAVMYAMFMAFKRGESLTKNDKLSVHRTYWLFLVAFGFLFFAVIVSMANQGSGVKHRKTKKSSKSDSDCGSAASYQSYQSYKSQEHSSPVSNYDGDSGYDDDDEYDTDA